MAFITMENVSKTFPKNIVGVDNISLEIEKGEFVFLLGRSGSGKSTLIKLLTREIEPTKGNIIIENENINEISANKMPFFRRKLGLVKQEFFLLEQKNLFDNVAIAMMAIEQPKKAIDEMVPAVLGMVGMRNKAMSYPHEISGGERMRVELARAIVNAPKVLIADEPTANLDNDASWDIMCLLDDINRLGITVIVATHAKDLVNILKKRVITLHHGKKIGDVKKGKYGDVVAPFQYQMKFEDKVKRNK